MTASRNGNRHANGRLGVEDHENLTFSVNRKVFVSDDVLDAVHRAILTPAGSMSVTRRN